MLRRLHESGFGHSGFQTQEIQTAWLELSSPRSISSLNLDFHTGSKELV
jgi:hypothetical protein